MENHVSTPFKMPAALICQSSQFTAGNRVIGEYLYTVMPAHCPRGTQYRPRATHAPSVYPRGIISHKGFWNSAG